MDLEEKECVWTEIYDPHEEWWKGTCGKQFTAVRGYSPMDCSYIYCPKCGGKIKFKSLK